MRFVLKPFQDASIYERYVSRNTGLDEILEVGKEDEGNYRIRSLVEFDLTQLSLNDVPPEAEFELRLYTAYAARLKRGQKIEIWTASGSLDEGTGYFYQDVFQEVDGVTWQDSGSYPVEPTGSIIIEAYGEASIPKFDVTEMVRTAVSASLPFTGILKFPDVDESDTSNKGNVRFFSSNTHTIYSPLLIAKWNSQTYSTGSMLALPSGQISVSTTVKPYYRVGETAVIEVSAREKYPTKTFATSSAATNTNYLPATSYYSVIDDSTGTVIVPFDDSSRIDVAGSKNYIVLPITGTMYPLRHYKVLIKVVRDGVSEIYDPKSVFTVVQ